jgi:hypothetical protein
VRDVLPPSTNRINPPDKPHPCTTPQPNPPQVVHSTDPAAIAAAARAPLPPRHRLCGFPDAVAEPASPTAIADATAADVATPGSFHTDESGAAAAAGRDVAACGGLEYDEAGCEVPVAAEGRTAAPADEALAAAAGGGATAAADDTHQQLPRRCGGRLRWLEPGAAALTLRVLLDHSLVEVFTSTGEVLSTRVYRDGGGCTAPVSQQLPQGASTDESSSAAAAKDGGAIELLVFGGGGGGGGGVEDSVAAVRAWEVGTIWVPEEEVERKRGEKLLVQQLPLAAA